MRICKKIMAALIVFNFIGNFAHASNCSRFNLWNAPANNWTIYGNVFSVGALFEPVFTGGLAATYVASSGSTAYYTLPASVSVASSNTPAYYSLLKGEGAWNNQVIQEGPYSYTWVGGATTNEIQYANKTGQNCDATVSLTPISGTTNQNIGGILVTVGLNGGQKITVSGHASTATLMTTPQRPYINLNMSLTGTALNLSTSGQVTITVPYGTPDGDYTGTIAMPYTVSACAGQVVCQDPRLLAHMQTGISNINATIRIRVVDGKPVNPDTYCHVSSGDKISIQHGILTPDIVNGNVKSNTITISCTGGTAVPVKVTLTPVGRPNTSSQNVGNKGILTPMSNGIDSLVTLDNGSTEKTINVNSTAIVKVNSELKTGLNAVMAGSFSGNAIATISYK
ncbi:TPA: hypothetical protein JLE25_004499 [Escherichia coli]|nr:hypothetical protein [Escherichia coli]HAV8881016.1 hypothetical protein [Escherichia coli]